MSSSLFGLKVYAYLAEILQLFKRTLSDCNSITSLLLMNTNVLSEVSNISYVVYGTSSLTATARKKWLLCCESRV